jgi:ATP-dependent helicase/DNAse subunit B
MNVEYLSASKIKTFEQCQLKYHAIYDLGLPEEAPHPLVAMGSAVHRMMEKATLAMMSGTGSTNPLNYKVAACKEFSVDTEYWPLIDSLVANATGWGYFRNIGRTKGVELEFFIDLEDGTKVKGYIDRLDLFDRTADIIDLKTQKNAFEPRELFDNWQARIYNIAVRKKFPEVTDKLCVSFWVLRHQVQKVHLTAEDAVKDCVVLMNKAKEIRACANPEPNPSGLCQFCLYRDKCPSTSLRTLATGKGIRV